VNVRIKKISEHAVIPKYAKRGDSGFDLVATEDVIIEPGETVKIPVGLAFEIPKGYELQIRPRSGITSKTKLRVQFGTVDSGYRGEVSVSVDNLVADEFAFDPEYYGFTVYTVNDNAIDVGTGTVPLGTYVIQKGDRIAQGVIAPVIQATFEETDQLSESDRGEGGFGSTGVKV
jgi:dUTP pyrophosphatase